MTEAQFTGVCLLVRAFRWARHRVPAIAVIGISALATICLHWTGRWREVHAQESAAGSQRQIGASNPANTVSMHELAPDWSGLDRDQPMPQTAEAEPPSGNAMPTMTALKLRVVAEINHAGFPLVYFYHEADGRTFMLRPGETDALTGLTLILGAGPDQLSLLHLPSGLITQLRDGVRLRSQLEFEIVQMP